MEGTPLRSEPPSPPPIPPSDPVALGKTNHWTDSSVAQKPLPYRTQLRVGPLETQRLQKLTVQLSAELGFPVVMDSPPTFPKKQNPGAPTLWFAGVTVGERSLTMDLARRRAAFRLSGGLACIGAVLVAAAVVLATYAPTSPAILPVVLPAGFVWAGVIIALNGIGSFDSDVLCIRYVGSSSDPMAGPLSADSPALFDVTIQAGRIASANWSSKSGSGRDFKAVLPGHEELASFPATAAQWLTARTS